MTKLVTVFGTRNPLEAQIVRGAFEAAGIDCHIVGDHQAGHTGIFEIQVVVRAEDEGQAREVLAASRERDSDSALREEGTGAQRAEGGEPDG
jgi:hypothetical protein